jgi:hypothetical protein
MIMRARGSSLVGDPVSRRLSLEGGYASRESRPRSKRYRISLLLAVAGSGPSFSRTTMV